MYRCVILLLLLGNDMEPEATSRPATSQPTQREVVTFILGGPQQDQDPLRWQPRGDGEMVASLFRDVDVVVETPDGHELALPAFNFFANASAGRVWRVAVRPAWPLTTQRDLAERLRAQFAAWDIPLNDNMRAFLAERDRVGDEMPDGFNTIQRCNVDPGEQTNFQIGLRGTKPRGRNKGGWFVVFEISLRNPQRGVALPSTQESSSREEE